MSSYLWFAVWAIAMTVLFGAYLFVAHRHQRDVRETVREMAVYVPVNTAVAPSNSRTFACPHFSVGNVSSAECGTCGPLPVAA